MERKTNNYSRKPTLLKRLLRIYAFIFPVMIITVFLTVLVLSVIDLISTSENSSGTSLLFNQDVQYEIRTNEVLFREKLTRLNSTYYNVSEYISLLDSIIKEYPESKDLLGFFPISRLKNNNPNLEFNIPVDKISDFSLIVRIKSIIITYEVDFDRLTTIVESSDNKLLTDEILKFGNFVTTSYSFSKTIDIVRVIVVLVLLISILIIYLFRNKIGFKTNRSTLDGKTSLLAYDSDMINEIEKDIKDNLTDENKIESIKLEINKIKNDLRQNTAENLLRSVLFEERSKADKKSYEIYNRSTLMLILGLLVAIAGVVVFFFLIPIFDSKIEPRTYLALTIRPTLILIFIQTIAFYLLKQYRSLINDYKYFQREYSKESRIFSVYTLIQKKELSDIEQNFIKTLLNKLDYSDNLPSSATAVTEDDGNTVLIDALKAIIDKIK